MPARPYLLAIAVMACLPIAVRAEVRLPKVISDHAVLQRERPIHLWGYATPGAHLTASFHAQNVSAVVNRIGYWSLYLAPEVAGGPYALTISGDGAPVTVSDLLVGDVWIASGQSNMEEPLAGFNPEMRIKNGDAEIAAAANPRLRLLVIEKKSSDYPLNDITTTWTTCTPATAKDFSAVAYFFGRAIAADQNVPVGLIDSTWGGTPADSWVSMDTLGTDAQLLPAFSARAHFAADLADSAAILAANQREDAAAKAAGKPMPSHPWQPFETSYSPAGLYNGMIAPLAPLTVEGFIWYQGETNSSPERAPYYQSLFSALIGDWRMHFAQGELPFLYAQISSFTSPGEHWGMIREAQRRTLDVANTAMAVTLDVGTPDNVHPPDKETTGARLALAARHMVYGESVPYRGPLFREATIVTLPDGTEQMQAWFNFGDGLTYRKAQATGFEVAGADHHFVPAQARIAGTTVIAGTPAVPHPMYVRFGWDSVVTDSLYNGAGLPTSTFSSEPDPYR